MGDYDHQEFMDLFGGLAEPGESYPSLDQVDELRKAEKEDPAPFFTEQQERALDACEAWDAAHQEEAEPEPRCVVCDRETHTFEQLQACRSMLKRVDRVDVERGV